VEWLWRTITYWRWQPFLKEREIRPPVAVAEPPPLPWEQLELAAETGDAALGLDSAHSTEAAGEGQQV
jgi:hypothetical protein